MTRGEKFVKSYRKTFKTGRIIVDGADIIADATVIHAKYKDLMENYRQID